MHNQPLHGIAVYNPDLLSKDELIQIFVARKPELTRLLDALRAEVEGPPQHHLVSGRRGMGKTTLLRRLRYAIEDDSALSTRWLGLNFPEEQYNVGSLSDFWLNCVDALADTLEAAGQETLLPEIDAAVERIQHLRDESIRQAESIGLLLSLADRLGRRFVLLVDNVDLVLDRLKKQEWALREVLAREERLVLIGASSAGLEHTYVYGAAFYDFFRLHYLDGLDDTETFTVMRRLAQAGGHAQVEAVLDREPARIRTIRLLAGGNPRTVVLLFNLLAQGVEGDVRSDLERLLDQCTPLYKHRFEDLPELSQRVVDALALHWHPMKASEVAAALRIDVNKASAQLNRLTKLGVVEKVDMKLSRLGFQIAERFFNIWYLMRASRRVRNRLTFLVEFLRMMFAPDELAGRSRRFLRAAGGDDRMRHAEYGMALSYAVEDEELRDALRLRSARVLIEDARTRELLGELFDLEGEHREFRDRAERIRVMSEIKEMVFAANRAEAGWDPAQFWDLLGGSLSLSVDEKLRIGGDVERLSERQISQLIQIFDEGIAKWRALGIGDELGPVREALCHGSVDAELEIGEARSAAIAMGEPLLLAFACAWNLEHKKPVDFSSFPAETQDCRSLFVTLRWAEQAVRNGIAKGLIREALANCDRDRTFTPGATHADIAAEPLKHLGDLQRTHLRCFEDAEVAYRRSLELDPENAKAWTALGKLLHRNLNRFEEAEGAYRRAIAVDPGYDIPWNELGNLFQYRLSRFDEAENAYREAIERDETDGWSWNGLAHLLHYRLKRHEDAEAAYRMALTHTPQLASAWDGLADLLHYDLGRHDEAESAYREAITRSPKWAKPWNNLGRLLGNHLERGKEAGDCYRQAVELAPTSADLRNDLAWHLFVTDGDVDEAIQLGRSAVEADSNDPYKTHTLACILTRTGNWPEAEPLARRFIAADEAYHTKTWTQELLFFAEAIKQGFASQARQLLSDLNRTERWQPLDLALQVAEAGSTDVLRRVAPEMRQAAELVLERIAPDLLGT